MLGQSFVKNLDKDYQKIPFLYHLRSANQEIIHNFRHHYPNIVKPIFSVSPKDAHLSFQ